MNTKLNYIKNLFLGLFVVLQLMFVTNIYASDHEQDAFGEDILLIINYNFAYYNSIPFLKKIYGNFFSNIVFYGPKKDPQVELCEHHEGWYSYQAISDAMQKFPGYQGYLFVHDDCFINFWNFSRFDKEKIWIVEGGWFSSNQPWGWWNKPCGIAAYKKVYNDLDYHYKLLLTENNQGEEPVRAFSDIAYIPGKYSKETIELCNICTKQGLFLEIAIPTICFCLDYVENLELVKGVRLWGNDRENPQKFYNKSIDFIHPLKFGTRPELKNFLETQVIDVIG
jgi:hypothetical protein